MRTKKVERKTTTYWENRIKVLRARISSLSPHYLQELIEDQWIQVGYEIGYQAALRDSGNTPIEG
ncbi:hypothetical protein LCGC14_0386560 [marine sediment metagenome]|uniref:Uncharacterized protein n=1 Tax=marine sediment metagenome TaxID=412755 RepID=A0A0F9TJ40_9ZZZZ